MHDGPCVPRPEGALYRSSCVKCGRQIPELVRDREYEQDFLHHAARRSRVTGREFADLAIKRSGDGPIRDHSDREWAREGYEEAADGGNYMAWWTQQAQSEGASPVKLDHIARAASAFALAFAEIQMAEDCD